MQSEPSVNHATARRLMRALESGTHGEELRSFFHPSVEQVEYPSLVAPTVGRRGLDAMIEASAAGVGLLRSQRYREVRAVESGDDLVLQLEWHAVLAVPLGAVPEGAELHTYSVLSLGFEDGLIRRIEAYDCYDPLPTA
ncbi:nuclear transport factor 2 family protein [Agromyces aurantiacus]|uniref:Nuclear transport factor 2 family protein n=1 Tax=Agromyces aurantiacus TaxID=165814 RepID=A0ABV9R2X8_9MICO|nr:nuclear transport factor 2 family protein [Agromyces aurantiacus]MBM7506167.1 hypothetical protein [Agromyces aurantiacus]